MSGNIPDSPLDKPRSEMNRAELRGKIARRAAVTTNWATPLDWNTLNSVYAYLTGEFYVPKSASHRPNHPDYKPRDDILLAVVHEAEIGELSDEWSAAVDGQPQGLRKDELLELDRTMADRGDQRDWAAGNDD